MSHVDEGALHAYLDGALDEYPLADAERIRAHLDACGACAARLEVERRVRSDAHAMLGLAAPVVDVPTFEELRAYVQRTAQQRRDTTRIQRLGWAASVVLALGAGWVLRGGQLQSRAFDIGQELTPTSGMAPAAAEATAERGRAFSDDPAAASAPTAREGLGLLVAGGDVSLAKVDEIPADAVAAAPDALRMELPSRQERVVEEEVLSADVMASGAPALTVLGDSGVSAQSVAVEQAGAVAQTGAAVRADADAAARRSREAAQPPASVVANAAQSEPMAGARVIERDVPTRALVIESGAADDETVVEPLLSVPGHEVLDVTNLGDGSTPWGVRVRQRTDDGRTFEVFHLEPGIAPSILPPLEVGVGEASVETAFGWVLVQGALGDEELGELLQGLFPEAR